jgi:hypothetical protein
MKAREVTETAILGVKAPNTQAGYIEALARAKARDLRRSALLPFDEKLQAVALVSRLLEDSLMEELPSALRKLFRLFDQAVQDGVIDRYALAGGFAIIYYGAPIHTVDADLLVVFPTTRTGLLDPGTLFGYFEKNGADWLDEYLVLNGLKFQLVPANGGLNAEALTTAKPGTEGFSVVDLEHLIAMKLSANRPKDRLHIEHLLSSGARPDAGKLEEILRRYGLAERWADLNS